MPGADAFYPPIVPPYGEVPAGGYGTPPPFLPHVFIDGAKRPTPEVEAEMQQALISQLGYDRNGDANGTNIDEHRIGITVDDADVVLDPTPLGDITVVVSTDDWKTFKAPVKALKGPSGDLIIIAFIKVTEDEDGKAVEPEAMEWPVATFVKWQYVYRNDYVV